MISIGKELVRTERARKPEGWMVQGRRLANTCMPLTQGQANPFPDGRRALPSHWVRRRCPSARRPPRCTPPAFHPVSSGTPKASDGRTAELRSSKLNS